MGDTPFSDRPVWWTLNQNAIGSWMVVYKLAYNSGDVTRKKGLEYGFTIGLALISGDSAHVIYLTTSPIVFSVCHHYWWLNPMNPAVYVLSHATWPWNISYLIMCVELWHVMTVSNYVQIFTILPGCMVIWYRLFSLSLGCFLLYISDHIRCFDIVYTFQMIPSINSWCGKSNNKPSQSNHHFYGCSFKHPQLW